MSLEKAREFLLRVGTDEEFKQYLEAARDWRSFALATDYDFTLEEFETVTNEIIEIEELRGEILEAIAGGQGEVHAMYGVVVNPNDDGTQGKTGGIMPPPPGSSKGKSWGLSWKLPLPKQPWWGGNS